MKKQFLVSVIFAALFCTVSVKAQWSLSTTNAFSYGCPGYICINGPTAGYTFAVNPPPVWGPIIPGTCGGSEYAVWAGYYSVSIIQNSTGNVLQTFSNVTITQPPCGLEILLPTVTTGCYNDNTLSFQINGLFCGGGNVTLNKNGAYFSGFPFSSPGQYYFDNLTPGNYQLIVADNLCSDNYSFTINDNCSAPTTGFSTTNITKTSARLNWNTKPCAVQYKVQYRPKSSTVWTTKYVGTNTGLKNLTGLTAGTIYKWRVKTTCNINPASASAWSAVQTFTTLPPREGIDEIQVEDNSIISVFPNPANNSVNITADFEIENNAALYLYDLSGKAIRLNFDRTSENSISVDLNSVSNGVYQIQLFDNNKIYRQKLVVIK